MQQEKQEVLHETYRQYFNIHHITIFETCRFFSNMADIEIFPKHRLFPLKRNIC